MKDIYVVLDIGSATIKLLVGESLKSNIHILFAKKIPSHGVKLGKIVDVNAVSRDIRNLLQEAQHDLDTTITSVALNVPSIHTKLYTGSGSVTLTKDIVESENVIKALQLGSKISKSNKDEIISVIPVCYHTDRESSYEVPLNKKSKSLVVDSLVVTSPKSVLYPYLQAVEGAGVEVLEIGLNAYSCAKEAFDMAYLQEGAILIDFGYKMTTISYFQDGYISYLSTCNVGGYNFTKRIASEFQIAMNQAEAYKIKYGSLQAHVGQNDIIHTTVVDGKDIVYTQEDLTRILNEEAKEVMAVIHEKLAIIEQVHNKEIVLVGGGSELTLLDHVASEILRAPVRIYRPDTIGARDQAQVGALGMMYYLVERSKILGKYKPSLVLPDVSSTMSLRFKGLTKTQTKNTGPIKLGKVLEQLFNED
ncbi:cell division FtsA domain-containing protein [Tannockella kyphosi]|uniref:cell division FtsA domain-containing protein n=1 Tax=Tannockella kyphosi TaxID=2899121 RepID=UPI0020111D66|nr:cell division FtsA domain-containing protein [Tannockella kyphosi]